ncbi:T9SS type A sorting domain-containing protein [bacterium]|nr:T9SS type A sorting domain-containing protein [bacterium]
MIFKTRDVRVKYFGVVFIVFGMVVLFSAGKSWAADFWNESFSGTPLTQPGGWSDETQDGAFNADIAYSYTSSWAAVTRTAEGTYGKVLSPNQTVDVDTYPWVEIVVTGISASTSWKLGIQEQEGSYLHWDLSGSQTGTGTFQYDYASGTGWTGTHTFGVEMIVEGNAGTYIEADSVRIYNIPTPTPSPVCSPTVTSTPSPVYSPTTTSTITPTPTVEIFIYQEEFVGMAGELPAGWVVDNGANSFNAIIAYSYTDSYAAVTRTANDTWGKVLSEILNIDVGKYPIINVVVQDVSQDAQWRIGMQEQSGSYFQKYLNDYTTETGSFYFNFAEIMGWETGTYDFSVELAVVGSGGEYFEIDSIRIGVLSSMPPTPTVTITPVVENIFRPSLNLFRPKQAPLELYYKIKSVESVTIKIYNLAGRKVRTLLDTSYSGQIASQMDWDGKNDAGDWVGSGVYILRIEAKNTNNGSRFSKNIRVVVVK